MADAAGGLPPLTTLVAASTSEPRDGEAQGWTALPLRRPAVWFSMRGSCAGRDAGCQQWQQAAALGAGAGRADGSAENCVFKRRAPEAHLRGSGGLQQR